MQNLNMYGNSVIDVANVRRWVKKFNEGETDKGNTGVIEIH